MRVAVIGGGIFGCRIALSLAEAGHQVTLFERRDRIMQGASRANHNRLHLGFHYPRDPETARQCLRGFLRFLAEFQECVSFGFPAHYYVASEGSLTSAADYVAFLDEVGPPYRRVPLDSRVAGCSLAVQTWEAVYDAGRLAMVLAARLQHAAGVDLRYSVTVDAIERQRGDLILDLTDLSGRSGADAEATSRSRFDAVVNCAYEDQNRLTAMLGIDPPSRLFEYTVVPIIEIPGLPRQAITIMDGPFCSIQPYGFTDNFLLYHARYSVLASAVSKFCPYGKDAPTDSMLESSTSHFETMKLDGARYIPALAEAKLLGWLQGPRMVLAGVDSTDARPSTVHSPLPGYITVFAGKVDHSSFAADDVLALLTAQ